MIKHDADGLGRVEVTTLLLPDFVKAISATYTYSGKVLLFYRTDEDPQDDDYHNIAVLNDDGTGFKPVFSGVIKQDKKANGIRHMPFEDNKRVHLGDYVLECAPDIDHCERAALVPVRYPWLMKLDPRTMKHWSEIIIAPDNEHMAWTILRTDMGAANAMGILARKGRRYVIKKPQIISALRFFEKDRQHEGTIVPLPMRGGEVKQFVRGGTAISLVGAKDSPSADSVVQDLVSGDLTQITHTPGYDETTIFSPDEQLGLVMSTRGSKTTNPAIFGLMPRPYGAYTVSGMMMAIYMYAVASVRSFRQGNIGPVLIEIERSMHEPGYQGVVLNDPEETWVYVSPMSWHPSSKKAMWQEMVRGSDAEPGGRRIRIRIATLHDYEPHAAVAVQRTPDAISYGIKGIKGALSLWLPPDVNIEGRIAGRHSGYLEHRRQGRKPVQLMVGSIESRYVNYSDDGKTFYSGFERIRYSPVAETTYEADLEMTGEQQGEMKLRATFSKISSGPPKLLLEDAEDGKPKSHGYAEYKGVRLNIEDMAP